MAETKSKDQQAFPDEFNEGMTLRDYFAAKAMQAYIGVGDGPLTKEIITKNAFEMADVMLAERNSINY